MQKRCFLWRESQYWKRAIYRSEKKTELWVPFSRRTSSTATKNLSLRLQHVIWLPPSTHWIELSPTPKNSEPRSRTEHNQMHQLNGFSRCRLFSLITMRRKPKKVLLYGQANPLLAALSALGERPLFLGSINNVRARKAFCAAHIVVAAATPLSLPLHWFH